jgi:hypothetical protein
MIIHQAIRRTGWHNPRLVFRCGERFTDAHRIVRQLIHAHQETRDRKRSSMSFCVRILLLRIILPMLQQFLCGLGDLRVSSDLRCPRYRVGE